MKTKLLRGALASLAIVLAGSASAEMTTLAKANGEIVEGEIEHLNEHEVSIKTSGGDIVSTSLEQLDAASRSALADWAASHPKQVGVFAAWDTKPVVTRSRNAVTPPALNAPGFRGIVSLDVILDEQGKVTWATVSKSTHAALDDSALEAIRGWAFKPAQIEGHPVKARISISFKFES